MALAADAAEQGGRTQLNLGLGPLCQGEHPGKKNPVGLGGASCQVWIFGQLPAVPLDCAVVRGVLSELQSELQQNERVLGQVIGQGKWI